MESKARALKRPRIEVVQSGSNICSSAQDLHTLIRSRSWAAATERAQSHPEEAVAPNDPSPLALSCRLGAPYTCVKAVLNACPRKLRHLLDSRGTPLHEAVVCDDAGPEVIRELLKADEELGNETPRATVMQDVDGYTPLHLLIRRRFQWHILDSNERSHLMELLEMMVKSCAEAVVIPDRGEYEEPPIVMALKANVYAPLLQSEDATASRIERNINDMVNCMLHHYPSAASCVFNGYRGKYTALHSAVFHGRCPDTIALLLEAEHRSPASQKAGLLANTQGEMPLHFCAMRGEPPRSVALLAEAAPEAVSKRDASGLTPAHWLFIRFVSTLLAIDDAGRDETISLPLARGNGSFGRADYFTFASVEQVDFETDLHMLRRLDPSVDFLRMRHIPNEVIEETQASLWAERTVKLLTHCRDRHEEAAVVDGENNQVVWTRLEAVASLFWTKVVSLLKAASQSESQLNSEPFFLVHTAFKSTCCPAPVCRIVAAMYPGEMSTADANGQLPLHHAASRSWHAWDWPREDGTSDGANAQLLQLESVSLLKTALSLSPAEAASHKDNSDRLPINCAILTFIKAFSSAGRSFSESPITDILGILMTLVCMNPDSLHEKDPETKLFPFLQASAVAAEENLKPGSAIPDEYSLSIVYQLLRENPSLIGEAI